MSRNRKFIKKTENFIETGSYLGDGIQLAIESGFGRIYSIELSENLYNHCVSRFSQYNIVNIVLGDSTVKLKEILDNNPNTSFTFWLDGHYSGGMTARGEKDCPLREELECILSRNITGEIIYIDDMRHYRDHHDINLSDIVNILNKYKPNCKYWFESSDLDMEDQMVIEY
jgi:hypothetical protein